MNIKFWSIFAAVFSGLSVLVNGNHISAEAGIVLSALSALNFANAFGKETK